MQRSVHAVIAVKQLDQAKSRLAAQFSTTARSRLVTAMVDDTLRATTAVEAIESVTVVTPNAAVAELARNHGARIHPEPVGGGLNAALADAALELRHRYGAADILALQADLPALRPAELAAALACAPTDRRSVVIDHQHTGTAALLAPAALDALQPQFGPDSARRHVASGALMLDGDWPGLRLDVDTGADLEAAIALGVGCATRAVLTEFGRINRPSARCIAR